MSEVARLYQARGFADTDLVSLCTKPVGGVFQSRIVTVAQLPDLVAKMAVGVDVWVGACPLREGIPGGRGTEADVLCLPGPFADLDFKPDGCVDQSGALKVLKRLVELLDGVEPVAIVESGHGIQPYWRLTEPVPVPEARSVLRRFGRLVAMAADEAGGFGVDSVFDLSRILRCPGTSNVKDPAHPVPATLRLVRP